MQNFSGKLIYAAAPTEQAEIEGLKRFGWSDLEIASMTPAQRRREFQEAMEIDDSLREQGADHAATAPAPPKPETRGEPPPESGGSATPRGPNPSPSSVAATTDQNEIEGLKRCGSSDDDIAGMTLAQRRAEFQDAMESVQGHTKVEFATRRENPSKPVEGAARSFLTKDLSGKMIYGGLGVIFLCAIFSLVFKLREAPQAVPGWDGLSSCSYMVSFDGKRHLWLSENHFARIDEPNRGSAGGSWSFNENAANYTITVDDQPVSYSVVAPGDGESCMLIKGDLATADLPRSWFYSRADVDDQSD
jgi:hypothetical protein